MSLDEKTESRIEEFEVKNRYGKRAIRLSEDDIVLCETPHSIICLDVEIKQENRHQKHYPESYFSNKVERIEEIDKVLNVIYTLLATIKLKKIWMQHHQYLKYIGVLSNKERRKMMCFLCHIYHPNKKNQMVRLRTLKKRCVGGNPMIFFISFSFILSLKF